MTFFERLLSIASSFKNKARVIKEGYLPFLQAIAVESCDDLDQMIRLKNLWSDHSRTLINAGPKVEKFTSRIQTKIEQLEAEERKQKPDAQMEDEFSERMLEAYWNDYIKGVNVEKIKDDDRDLVEI